MTIAANQQPAASRLPGAAGRAWAWWIGELRGAWADATARLDRDRRSPLTIEAGEDCWILRRDRSVIGRVDRTDADAHRDLVDLIPPAAQRRTVVVDIPPDRALSKTVVLPAAARAELDRILEFEAARHFPFPADRAVFAYRVLGRGREAGAIEVELVAVPRDIVRGVCDELAAAGIRPSGIAVAAGGGHERLFLPAGALGLGESAAAPPRRRRLALAVAALAVVALLSWPLAQGVKLMLAEAELAALQPQAKAAIAAREQQQSAGERVAAVLRLRAERPPLIGVLDRLSETIPDGTWLISLGLSGRELVIDGLSPSAATVALALERSQGFTGIVFRSPITRDPTTGLEHFQLGATVAGRKP
ncbi:MAG TPA: PilN domain-containing protein [Stellaceae bacterium]|nr:PilN domain-containing protein [Stellaceae bacterium]